jgi:hypothetical protein
MDNRTLLQQGGLDMEGQTQIVAFRRNCVKLAWAFIHIMNVVHHFEILHNNLSKDNIMLHFLPNKSEVVCIGICNWGETRHLQEVMPSLYGFTKEQNATNTMKMCWWVAPILFFYVQQIGNCKSPLMNGQATLNNFEV